MGVDGTLKDRLRGTPAEGKVLAKTGTLRLSNALAGYATHRLGGAAGLRRPGQQPHGPVPRGGGRDRRDRRAVPLVVRRG